MKSFSTLFFSIFFLLISNYSYSQSDHLGALFHITIPLGDYADEQGRAELGWLIKGQYDHLFNDKLGLCGTVFLGQNPVDDEGFSASVDVDPYNHFGVFLGGVAMFGDDNFRFKLRAMPGIISTSTPEITDSG